MKAFKEGGLSQFVNIKINGQLLGKQDSHPKANNKPPHFAKIEILNEDFKQSMKTSQLRQYPFNE